MLNSFANWIVEDLLNLALNSNLGKTIHFFVYDTIQIFLLLIIMVFIISFIRSYFPPEKTKKWLSGKNYYIAIVMAAFLGILSPFCSCSTVPLFIGFVEAGIPLGVTFTFLISSPIVNEVSLAMLLTTFGVKLAVIYTLSGIIIAIGSGILIGKLKLENQVEDYVYNIKVNNDVIEKFTLKERVKNSFDSVKSIVKRIWIYILIGIAVGAWIHGYVPEDFLVQYLGKDNLLAVPIATLIGVPLYSNAIGSIPVIEALIDKGVGVGTAMAFMMAITALSLPEVILLRKVIKPKLLSYFLGIVTLGIILIGYLFNFLL